MKIQPATSQWFGEQGVRLDASYHLSEARQAKFSIDKSPLGTKTLSEVTERIFLGGRFRRVYVSDSERGYPYLTASDMTKAEPFSATYLSKTHTKNQEKLMIRKGWILLSCSGSIGRTVFTNELFEGQIGTHDLIRIVPDHEALPAGYLYAFLSSKYGYSLLTQGTYGGVIQHIEPHHIKDLPIPLLPEAEQAAIHAMIEEAAQLRVEANRLLEEAEREFYDLVGVETDVLNKLTSATEKDTASEFSVNSITMTSLTLRARNYGRRLFEIVNVLASVEHDNLSDLLLTAPYYTGRFKRLASESATSVELLSQGAIFEAIPKGIRISPRTIPNLNQEITKKGMILIPGQGTLGENEIFARAKFAWGYLENRVVAGHVVRFVPNEEKIDAGYLYVVLNSKLWFRILRSSVYGTNLLGFVIPMLNSMPIPRFTKLEEERMGSKAKTAYEKMTKANELETAAIGQLEEWIEAW